MKVPPDGEPGGTPNGAWAYSAGWLAGWLAASFSMFPDSSPLSLVPPDLQATAEVRAKRQTMMKCFIMFPFLGRGMHGLAAFAS